MTCAKTPSVTIRVARDSQTIHALADMSATQVYVQLRVRGLSGQGWGVASVDALIATSDGANADHDRH